MLDRPLVHLVPTPLDPRRGVLVERRLRLRLLEDGVGLGRLPDAELDRGERPLQLLLGRLAGPAVLGAAEGDVLPVPVGGEAEREAHAALAASFEHPASSSAHGMARPSGVRSTQMRWNVA
jgi:hypothetical protein